MWHLKKVSSKTLDRYAEMLMPIVEKHINDRRANANYAGWCAYLLPVVTARKYDNSLLKKILVSEPEDLYSLNRQIESDLHSLWSEGNLQAFLKEVFNYGIIKGKKSYEIAMMKQVNTCTYCNRQYTLTIGVSKKHNGTKTSKVRPQFDHWFAYEQYPLMGLSFYNLIPSCSVCNSSVKGTAQFDLGTHIHPYTSPNSNPNFKFRPVLKYDEKLKRVKWGVKIIRTDGSKEDNTINALMLEEIYDNHGELEVKDIMDFAIKNNPTYLKTLFKIVCKDLHKDYSQADVYRMLFGVEADVERTLNRPFSKLKRDVLEGEGIIV